MTEFYTELKSMRDKQGIDLEEIHNRTKISLNYLHAIENGRFDLLPHTYIRLFIRAYAIEIGADSEQILNDLENFLGSKTEKLTDRKTNKEASLPKEEKHQLSDDDKTVLSQFRSAKKVHADMVKGLLLVGILIFAIYIIRVINAEEATKMPTGYPNEFTNEGSINEQDLLNNYNVLTESIQMLEAEPPYQLKLATAERAWFRRKIDSLNSAEDVLPPGDNRVYEFNQSINLLFKHSKGLNIYLNGSALSSLNSSSNPVRISLSSIEKSVAVQHFVPKN